MLEIKVFGEKEDFMRRYSEEISKVFLEAVNEIYENPEIYHVDSAFYYEKEGNTVLIGLCSLIAGFILACLFFSIEFLLDTKIKSCKDIEEITGLKSLISIPNIPYIAKKKLNIRNIRAHKSEVFKLLMTNIQFVSQNPLESKSILVTSSHSLEGKTYVATNLAIEFAKVGKKVILIDGDMRKGRIAKVFNLPNDLGFSNYLSHLDANGNLVNERITRFIHDTEIKNLNVITSGNVPPNPMELLKTERVNELIKDLKVFYDVVIVDTVSLLEAPEASQLTKSCDLSFILASYGKTKKEDLLKAYLQINHCPESCIGMGFNKIPDTKLKKEIILFVTHLKKRMSKIVKKCRHIFKKIGKVLKIIIKFIIKCLKMLRNIVQMILTLLLAGLAIIQKALENLFHHLKKRSQTVKEQIQKHKKKKEKVKLIEAGNEQQEETSNIIKDVFEEKIAKLETDELEYRKKLDHLKANIETNNTEIPKIRPVISKPEPQEKSKFDLIREQQKKEGQEKEEKQPSKVFVDETVNSLSIEKEEKQENEKIEPIIKVEVSEPILLKEEKEKKVVKQDPIKNYEEIDLSKQEHITEEMIRRQVEIDEMVRLAEKEEEEENLKIRREKKEERMKKNQAYKEKIKHFFHTIREEDIRNSESRVRKMETKIEEKIKRENEKLENRARLQKTREEKRAYREMEKQRQREELRLQEELQEDNLYPRPRI